MYFKPPKDDDKICWTRHVKEKMKYYGLSERRIKRILKNPERLEEGIANHTIAAMQRADKKKRLEEIWLMYQEISPLKGTKLKTRKRIISAWRYPGKSPIHGEIPIPKDILEDLENIIR